MKRQEDFKGGSFYCGYSDKKGEDSLFFDDGELEASVYSYEIASCGTITLDKLQTLNVYNAMKVYYETTKKGLELRRNKKKFCPYCGSEKERISDDECIDCWNKFENL